MNSNTNPVPGSPKEPDEEVENVEQLFDEFFGNASRPREKSRKQVARDRLVSVAILAVVALVVFGFAALALFVFYRAAVAAGLQHPILYSSAALVGFVVVLVAAFAIWCHINVPRDGKRHTFDLGLGPHFQFMARQGRAKKGSRDEQAGN